MNYINTLTVDNSTYVCTPFVYLGTVYSISGDYQYSYVSSCLDPLCRGLTPDCEVELGSYISYYYSSLHVEHSNQYSDNIVTYNYNISNYNFRYSVSIASNVILGYGNLRCGTDLNESSHYQETLGVDHWVPTWCIATTGCEEHFDGYPGPDMVSSYDYLDASIVNISYINNLVVGCPDISIEATGYYRHSYPIWFNNSTYCPTVNTPFNWGYTEDTVDFLIRDDSASVYDNIFIGCNTVRIHRSEGYVPSVYHSTTNLDWVINYEAGDITDLFSSRYSKLHDVHAIGGDLDLEYELDNSATYVYGGYHTSISVVVDPNAGEIDEVYNAQGIHYPGIAVLADPVTNRSFICGGVLTSSTHDCDFVVGNRKSWSCTVAVLDDGSGHTNTVTISNIGYSIPYVAPNPPTALPVPQLNMPDTTLCDDFPENLDTYWAERAEALDVDNRCSPEPYNFRYRGYSSHEIPISLLCYKWSESLYWIHHSEKICTHWDCYHEHSSQDPNQPEDMPHDYSYYKFRNVNEYDFPRLGPQDGGAFRPEGVYYCTCPTIYDITIRRVEDGCTGHWIGFLGSYYKVDESVSPWCSHTADVSIYGYTSVANSGINFSTIGANGPDIDDAGPIVYSGGGTYAVMDATAANDQSCPYIGFVMPSRVTRCTYMQPSYDYYSYIDSGRVVRGKYYKGNELASAFYSQSYMPFCGFPRLTITAAAPATFELSVTEYRFTGT